MILGQDRSYHVKIKKSVFLSKLGDVSHERVIRKKDFLKQHFIDSFLLGPFRPWLVVVKTCFFVEIFLCSNLIDNVILL